MRSGSVRRSITEVVAVPNSNDARSLPDANTSVASGDRRESVSLDDLSKISATSDSDNSYKVLCSTPRGMRGPGVSVVPSRLFCSVIPQLVYCSSA
jgi:hypothetical protein